MEEIALCAEAHREVFQRVWNRVMAGHPKTGCPVEVTGDLTCEELETLTARPICTTPDQPSSDLLAAGLELPCPTDTTLRLRQQVLEALEGWQLYRHLARRTRNGAARTLTELANQRHKQAQKLAASYFLLTGMRYWPSETLSTPAIPSLWGTLRRCHQGEQQAELSYHLSESECNDPALAELYGELAEGCRERCRRLRELLEQSCS